MPLAAFVFNGEEPATGRVAHPARGALHSSRGAIDSLKVDVGAAEKHSMGHTPLVQRRTPEKVGA